VFCVVFCRPLFVFSGVRIAHSSVFCVVFCRPLFVFSVFVLLILQCSVQCFVDHCLFLVGFVLLILQGSVQCFVDHCLAFFLLFFFWQPLCCTCISFSDIWILVTPLVNRSYSAILATLQITSYVHSRNSS
jgi:hypothetical protein